MFLRGPRRPQKWTGSSGFYRMSLIFSTYVGYLGSSLVIFVPISCQEGPNLTPKSPKIGQFRLNLTPTSANIAQLEAKIAQNGFQEPPKSPPRSLPRRCCGPLAAGSSVRLPFWLIFEPPEPQKTLFFSWFSRFFRILVFRLGDQKTTPKRPQNEPQKLPRRPPERQNRASKATLEFS